MPTLTEVWESRVGIHELPGAQNSAAILEMWKDAGHPEVTRDEEHWCSAAMCSAAKAAGYPFPPVNVNPMARSWLTMGVAVKPEDVRPEDVIVWPRGAPPSGHVNCVKEVRRDGDKIEVKCWGGNQTKRGTGGAVTVTDWTDLGKALPNGIRRLVRPTVQDLRAAGSSTIKAADTDEKLGIVGAFFVPIFEGVRAVVEPMFGLVEAPKFASLPESLTFWGSVMEQANRVFGYVVSHPWMAGILLVSIGLVIRSKLTKRGRVAEHKNGVPIASEVAALQGA